MATETQVCRAIQNKSIVLCTYQQKSRKIWPLALYKPSTGTWTLAAWQVEGETKSKTPLPSYKNFHLHEILEWSETDDFFVPPPPNYNPQEYANIRCQVTW